MINFFIKSQTSCKSSTLLKLRAKQEEGFPDTAKGKKIHHSGLKWALLTTSIAARSVDPTSHWPAALEQKKARTQGETFRLDQSRVPTPSSPLGSVRYKWLLEFNTSLTYLTFPFIGCTVMEKLCHQTFQCPERGFFRCLTKEFEKKSATVFSVLCSSVPSRSHSTVIVIYFLKTSCQHSSDAWYKPEKLQGISHLAQCPKL